MEFIAKHPFMSAWLAFYGLVMLFSIGFNIGTGDLEVAFWQALVVIMYLLWFAQNRLASRSLEMNGRLLTDLENVTKFAEGQQRDLHKVLAENRELKEKASTLTDKPVEVAAAT